MKRVAGVILFLTIVLALSPLGVVSAQPRRWDTFNGYDWLGWDEMAKLTYVMGFLRAANSVSYYAGLYAFLSSADTLDKYKSASRENLKKKAHQFNENIIEKFGFKIAPVQVVEGMDSLYADFKNKGIQIQDAVYFVKEQIQGASPEEIEATLEWLRANKSPDKSTYKDKEGRTHSISFPLLGS